MRPMSALEPWTFVIGSHAIAAFLCLFLGGFQVFRRTKGDSLHRLVGRIWAVLMLVVAAGSFLFGGWSEPVDWFLRALATWTLVSVTLGWLGARSGSLDRHRGMMVGTYIGLVVAFVFVVAIPSRQVPSWFVAHPAPMSLVAVLLMATSTLLVLAAYAATRHPDRAEDRTPDRAPG